MGGWPRGRLDSHPPQRLADEHRLAFAEDVDERTAKLARTEERPGRSRPARTHKRFGVLFENDRVRLLEVRLRPGDGSARHSHPDYLVYALEGGKVRLTSPDGESGEVDVSAGDVMWREAEEHSTENTGTTELRALFFELK